jgi:spore coat protein U-like protein
MKHKLLMLALLLATNSFAQTATSPLQVTTTLNSSCVVSVDNMSFGVFQPQTSGYVTTSSNIRVICSKATTYRIGASFHTDGSLTSTDNWNGYQTNWARNFSGGGNADGYPYNRVLTGVSKGETLLYDIYSNSSYTTLMGDQNGLINGVGTSSEQTYPIYGRMRSNQFVAADTYVNNVVISVVY